MKIKIFSISFLIILWVCRSGSGYGQNGTVDVSNKKEKINDLEIPKFKPHEEVIRHTCYTLSFNDIYVQANWVAYELTKEESHGNLDRTNNFKPDPAVTSGTATDQDYQYTGYDKGHLAPAGDMKWSSTAIAESFYYSNMSPQYSSFNRGIWKKLEDRVRVWAEQYESVYIVTGPILKGNLPTIGIHKVAVPRYFYKVILDYTEPSLKGIGFILPNENSSEPLQHFAITIDSVEKVTGIDFFPLLPDYQEKVIESTLTISDWSWKSSSSSSNKTSNPSISKVPSISIQCSATTKAGTRCKRMTKSPNGKCWQHGGD